MPLLIWFMAHRKDKEEISEDGWEQGGNDGGMATGDGGGGVILL